MRAEKKWKLLGMIKNYGKNENFGLYSRITKIEYLFSM